MLDHLPFKNYALNDEVHRGLKQRFGLLLPKVDELIVGSVRSEYPDVFVTKSTISSTGSLEGFLDNYEPHFDDVYENFLC